MSGRGVNALLGYRYHLKPLEGKNCALEKEAGAYPTKLLLLRTLRNSAYRNRYQREQTDAAGRAFIV